MVVGKKSWTCLKCGRKFGKKNQSHSCVVYPVEEHFRGKEAARVLYNRLKEQIRKNVGPFRVDSPRCCIHFVTTTTFAAVYALKDRIRVDFALDHRLDSPRIVKFVRMSANRHLHYVDIKDKEEIDKELINWIKQAYNSRKK